MKLNVVEVLRNYRWKERYSQEEMAQFLNVSQATYHNWESGKFQVHLKHYPVIALRCQIKLTDILPDEFSGDTTHSPG